MKTNPSSSSRHLWLLILLFLFLPAGAAALALQQEAPPDLGAFALVPVLFALAVYAYFAFALQTIAAKTNTENGWLAWIPIVNIVLMLNIAKKPLWWIVLLFIPLVNIIIGVLVWMAIAEARGKPGWWGILLIVPFVNLIVPGYLAFSD